ncbi:Protein SSXA1 [Lemmus lemmus]
MKTGNSYVKSSVKDTHESKKMSQAFQDISTYFSEEEWAKRTTWQKSLYVYMKRNYIRMTALGVTVNKPVFMRCKKKAKKFLVESIEVHSHDSEGEWSGSVKMPGKVTGRSLLIHVRAVWKRVHSEDYVEDLVI